MIPQEVIEQIERGHVVLFIGERIAHEADGRLLIDRLTAELAGRVGINSAEVKEFPEAAQAYEDEAGRPALLRFLREQFVANGDEPPQALHLMAKLNQCRVLVTTCLDQGVEQAFLAANRPLDVVIGNGDLPAGEDNKAHLYKLCGSIAQDEPLVLTEEDYEAFFEDPDSIPTSLKGHLARKVLLFVGFDLGRTPFKRLYHKVTAGLDNQTRFNYAVVAEVTAKESRWCERYQIEPITVEPTAFLQTLTEQLEARAQVRPVTIKRPVTRPSTLLPERPYKLLDYYEAQDADIFFGRERETQLLSSLIHAHRLVLLYGASGTGKTSLLLAGVGPFLERVESPYQFIYVRALEDPSLAIRRAVRWRIPATMQDSGSDSERKPRGQEGLLELRPLMNTYFNESELRDLCFDLSIDYEGLAKGSKGDSIRELITYCQRRGRISELITACCNLRPHVSWPEEVDTEEAAVPIGVQNILKGDGPLVDFLDAATRVLNRQLIIVLDQFEEFFVRLSPQFRAAFIAELGTLYDARDVPIKVVLSLREDWLAAVGEIEERILGVFNNRMRLLSLSREQARPAITAPVELLGITYEPELVEQLLADLTGRESAVVMPPQLQLVCSALYNRLGSEEHLITLAAYERLGGARGVLQKYLEDELARFGREERAVARIVLEELVTSQGTKAVKMGEELAITLDSDLAEVRPVLEKLVRARLLRALELEDGEIAYELAHEYLIAEARKQTEELITVLNGILHLVGQYRPLLFFGLPGSLLMLFGLVWGVWVVKIYSSTHQLAIGYAMISVLLSVIGLIMLSTGIILHSVRSMMIGMFYHRSLLFFGLPGLLLMLVGLVWGVWFVEIYSRTLQLAIGGAMISILLSVIGLIMLSTGIILHSVHGLMIGMFHPNRTR